MIARVPGTRTRTRVTCTGSRLREFENVRLYVSDNYDTVVNGLVEDLGTFVLYLCLFRNLRSSDRTVSCKHV